MREAAPDIFIFHAGITRGGFNRLWGGAIASRYGCPKPGSLRAARKIKPDVILLAHGAALANPDDAQYILDHTDCHGVQLGSSVERLALRSPSKSAPGRSRRSGFFETKRVAEKMPLVSVQEPNG